MSAYFPVSEAEDDVEHLLDELEDDPRTQLDKTIDRIGMGSYQWTLLCLCGFGAQFSGSMHTTTLTVILNTGWMADNVSVSADSDLAYLA